ncbi:MAG: RrF2 family transcriptional regulator [Acidimicrobiales bacterium]
MTLSKRGDYVVRSALALARAWPSGEARKIREVVAEMGVPQTFASQILADLVRAGLASSKAGKDGGYRLSRPPQEIALVDVVEAGEGPLRAERCALGDGPCRWDAVCPLHETWRAATDALRQVLGATSLADLAERDVEIEQGRVSVPPDAHRHGGTSVEVADWVHVELDMKAVVRGMQDQERFAKAIEAGYLEADSLRASLYPGAPAWSPVHALATCAERSAQPDEDASAEKRSFTLSWEAVGATGAASHADVHLAVTAVDPARTQLRLSGRFRPPEHRDDLHTSGDLLPRLTQVVTRSLLRRLAHGLEARGARIPDPTAGVGAGAGAVTSA